MTFASVFRITAASMLVIALAGCAATGAKYEEAARSMPAMKSDEGRVFFIRSSSMFGAAIQPDLRLNGTVVGTSKPGGFFYVDRPAGNYSASAQTETEKTLSFNLGAGETKYIRSTPAMGIIAGRINLDLEKPEVARDELRTLSYTGPAAAR